MKMNYSATNTQEVAEHFATKGADLRAAAENEGGAKAKTAMINRAETWEAAAEILANTVFEAPNIPAPKAPAPAAPAKPKS